mmetsp:Transcript_69606/g.163470  ORF Transcript_69606/g.163470 Transcript_69606/m.163470 type:complete len:228 (-) Transcript_69606:263-946(-)
MLLELRDEHGFQVRAVAVDPTEPINGLRYRAPGRRQGRTSNLLLVATWCYGQTLQKQSLRYALLEEHVHDMAVIANHLRGRSPPLTIAPTRLVNSPVERRRSAIGQGLQRRRWRCGSGGRCCGTSRTELCQQRVLRAKRESPGRTQQKRVRLAVLRAHAALHLERDRHLLVHLDSDIHLLLLPPAGVGHAPVKCLNAASLLKHEVELRIQALQSPQACQHFDVEDHR